MKNVQFEQTRKALQSKQRDLKREGMGNKPNASAALNEEDIQVLFEKDLFGSSTAEALLNTVWFNNNPFRVTRLQGHREMCSRGDVKLWRKTRNDPWNVKAVAPKMFAVPNNQKCPARAYKVYAEKRPAEMETNDAPFTLTVNNVKSGNNDVPQTDIMQLSGHKNG